MARARNIKPGFFKNEDLAECSPWARLCFAGLWVLADREGRLEDRPKRIKGELFPFDAVEVEPLLQELERFKFIQRYESEGLKAIQILEFARHQTPHYSEKPSVIKPPGFQELGPHEPPNSPGGLQEGSKKSGAMKRGSQPPDSLNPDSLNPDSPKKSSDADASGAAPPQAKALTTKDRVWMLGPPLLGDTPSGRSLLGKLAKTYGEDVLVAALVEATGDRPVDPKSWLVAACEARAVSSGRRSAGEPAADLLSDPRPEWATRAGFPDRFQAENAGCKPGNAHQFRDGRRIQTAPGAPA